GETEQARRRPDDLRARQERAHARPILDPRDGDPGELWVGGLPQRPTQELRRQHEPDGTGDRRLSLTRTGEVARRTDSATAAEDAHSTRPDQQANDDEHDAGDQATADYGEDPRDDQDGRDDPEDG